MNTRIQSLLIVLAALVSCCGMEASSASVAGYLDRENLHYAVPPAPSDPEVLKMELVQVRDAQPAPGSARLQEAVADAQSYTAEEIVTRFDEASQEALDASKRPLLVAMLRKMLSDTGDYASDAKRQFPRARPFVEDPHISACYLQYLGQNDSYPSGHAMNGYVVALALTQVIPERSEQILSRGLAYGDNRVVCGVHHPLDVEQGRLLGIAYWSVLQSNQAFKDDLACAKQEESAARGGAGLSAACRLKRDAAPLKQATKPSGGS